MIALAAGDWTATLRPDLGGAVAGLTFQDRDILRPTPSGTTDVLQTACFPLVPYANRIAGGRFAFGGREVALEVLPAFAPNALHGDGWRAPWRTVRSAADGAELAFDHAADGWPWAYEARQVFTLTTAGLTIRLSVRNTATAPMPAGLGLHPYFPAGPDSRLTVQATGVWCVDETLIPTRLEPPCAVQDWSAGPRLGEAASVDHCYAGWTGPARLTSGKLTTLVSSPEAAWLHVFTPAGAGYACLEPVSHRPDAVNAPAGEVSGLVVLEPGETFSLGMTIGLG
ncbi:MAG: aldose 1-epimerase [Caulobacter sp.]|nr:aldose 1-epimerase [Caulobacter sp.]